MARPLAQTPDLAAPAPHAAAGPRADRRIVVAVLAVAAAAAAALRLPFLATQSLWFDETYTVHVVRAGSLGELWHRIGASESTPPLFYLVSWAWVHAFGSEAAGALRAVPALALIAAVPVAYAALRRLVGWRAALATAWLVAVSPLLGWYALDARAYGLLVLTGLLSVWAFGAVLEATAGGASAGRRGPGTNASDGAGARAAHCATRPLALWALACAAALWTHWFAGFLVLAEALALLWLRPRSWRATLAASAAVGLALLPLLGLLRDQTGDDRAAFIAGSGLGGRLEQLVRQFGAGVNVPRTWLEAAALAIALAAVAVGTLLTARRALARPFSTAGAGGLPTRDGARALLALVAVGLGVPLALAATRAYDRFDVRNVIYLWPLAAALAAPALLRLRGVPLAALLALGIATSLWTQADWRYGNADWRTAIARIQTPAARDVVVAVTPLGQPVASLYLDRVAVPHPVAGRRVWLVVEPARRAGSRALQPADPPVVAQLLAAFARHHERARTASA